MQHEFDEDTPRMGLLIAAVIAVIVLAWALFLRGGGDTGIGPGARVAGPRGEAPAVRGGQPAGGQTFRAAPPGSGPVETFEVFAPKDPFAPMVEAPGDDGAAEGESGEDEVVGGHRITLVDVFEDKNKARAQVQIDSTVYTVDVGEVFADSFKLLSASGECASVLYGDDQFSLCEGEEILK